MGHAVAASLAERGFRLVSVLAGRSELTRDRAARAGIEDAGDLDGVLRAAEGVLAILPPAEAEPLARRVAEAMVRTGCKPIYADCNAVSPATTRKIAAVISKAGAPFVDAGIIGVPPGPDRADTRFYASGPRAKWLEGLAGRGRQGGMAVIGLGEEIGRASAIKMAYAALTKGTMTLQTAVLVTAMRLCGWASSRSWAGSSRRASQRPGPACGSFPSCRRTPGAGSARWSRSPRPFTTPECRTISTEELRRSSG